MYYRAISQNKWLTLFSNNNYSGDAITGDLRTSNNTLSIWRIDETNVNCIDDYCIITALNRDSLAKVVYVILDDEELKKFTLNQVDGVCEAFIDSDIKKNHYDLINIGYKELGDFAKLISEKVQKGQFTILTKSEMKQKIQNSNSVDKNKISGKFFKN